MKNILIVILLLSGLYVSAQVPGYQGLRFSVKYDCGINHPAIVGRPGKLPMLYHNASLDYVVGRAWSVGLKYGFMTYNAPVNKKVLDTDEDGTIYSGNDYNNNDYRGRYTQHTVGFIAKKFLKRRGYIAPIGRYVTIGAFYQHATNHYVQISQQYNEYGYATNKLLMGYKTTSHYGGVTVGMGRNFVVANRILFDLGFNLNLALPTPDVVAQNGDIKKAAYTDLLLRNIFQLYLGFGVLAF